MTHTVSGVTFGAIKNVRKSGDEDEVYFADVEIQEAEGFPFTANFYCARSDDYAMTGRWVYQQIIDGNIEGEIVQLAPNVNPVTGLPNPPPPAQPPTFGAQTL
jgi:hypothetical protein